MRYRLVVTGAGGFIGSYLVPCLERDGWDVVKIKYVNGKLEPSSPLLDGEQVIVLNLAAATSGANRFSMGYDLSVVMIEKLCRHFQSLGVTVQKFIQFSSFGELYDRQRGMNRVFYRMFKEPHMATGNYQYWKIKQRNAVSFYFTNVFYVVIPFVTDKLRYEEVKTSFKHMRRGRKILVTRLVDILACVNKILRYEPGYGVHVPDGIHIPNFQRVKIRGSFSFIKQTFSLLSGSLLFRDRKKLYKLGYQISSQMLK